MDSLPQIIKDTQWFTTQQDLTAARLSYLLRLRGIDVNQIVCAKIFPSTNDPTGGVLIVAKEQVFQFGFNRSGMILESAQIDEWINISSSYKDHIWRDEILTALQWATDYWNR